jgi:hypothetical protein
MMIPWLCLPGWLKARPLDLDEEREVWVVLDDGDGLDRRLSRHQERLPEDSPGPCLRRYSFSFFSSIILSSRPTVSRRNCSSSASRSSAVALWAISLCAWFCAVTSRAAANTPRTLPPVSR